MEIYTESNVPTKDFCFIYFTGMHMEHLFCVTFVMFQHLGCTATWVQLFNIFTVADNHTLHTGISGSSYW